MRLRGGGEGKHEKKGAPTNEKRSQTRHTEDEEKQNSLSSLVNGDVYHSR